MSEDVPFTEAAEERQEEAGLGVMWARWVSDTLESPGGSWLCSWNRGKTWEPGGTGLTETHEEGWAGFWSHSGEGSCRVKGPRQGRVQDPQGGTLRWGSECVSALEGQAGGPPWQGGGRHGGVGACHEGAEPVSGRQGGGCWGRGIACAGGPFRVLWEEE